MSLAETETGNETEVLEQAERQEAEQEKSGEGEGGEAGEQADGVVVTIGEESPPQEEERAPDWVRELRKKHQETQRLLREREEEIARLKAPAEKPALGAEPTLEGCDYDAPTFARELKAWMARKADHDAEERRKTEAVEADKKAWQAKLDRFTTAKAGLKVQDFDDAEALVKESLSVIQQGVILSGAKTPAVLVYALGKNPKKLKELSSIADPVQFAFACAELETQLKVTPRKAAPLPEDKVSGSAPVTGTADSHLERLRAEAARTGDSTKVLEYKRKLKEKSSS